MTRILKNIRKWQGTLFINSGFLMANSVIGSVLGFLFWTLAARRYGPTELGIGTAYIAAMMLLANFGQMGLDVTLIRFVPSMGSQQTRFINSSLTAVAISTLIIAVIFISGTPILSPELSILTQSSWHFAVFIGAILSFSLAIFLDRLYIAIQLSHYLFIRNLLNNILKIILLVLISVNWGGITLLMVFGIAALVTFALSAMVFAPRTVPSYRIRPDFAWSLLWEKARYSLGNHFAQLLWNAPPRIYPLLIIALLGAEANAHFYISWMIANILFMVPAAVSTASFARSANDVDKENIKFWRSMALTLIGLLPIVVGMVALSSLLLSFFGQDYVSTGRELLIWFLLSVFPYTINTFVIVNYRIEQNIRDMVLFSSLIAVLSLILIIVFGTIYGLQGIGLGWISSQVLGVIVISLYHRVPWTLYRYRLSIIK